MTRLMFFREKFFVFAALKVSLKRFTVPLVTRGRAAVLPGQIRHSFLKWRVSCLLTHIEVDLSVMPLDKPSDVLERWVGWQMESWLS
jgi:hypothetical protein